MARTYIWRGEAEAVVPFTLDGPRVVDTGDEIHVADDDDSFVDHPLWEPVRSGPQPTPALSGPVVTPISDDPDEPESQEPTA